MPTMNGQAQSGKEQSKFVFIEEGKPMTTTRHIAKIFEKRHDDVLKGINTLLESVSSVKDVRNFAEIFLENDPHIFLFKNFLRVTFKDSYGRE